MTRQRFPCAALLLLLLAAIPLRAQEEPSVSVTPPTPETKAPEQGSVSGHVICRDTRSPARGARVMLMPTTIFDRDRSRTEGSIGQPVMALTTLDGAFFAAHVPPGEYFVEVLAAGYLSAFDGSFEPSMGRNRENEKALEKQLRATVPVVTVTPGAAARIDVELQRGAILSGRVVYADGAPATQIRVILQNEKALEAPTGGRDFIDVGAMLRNMVLRQSLTTDDEGHFRLAGISPGRYRIAVPQESVSGNLQDAVFLSFMDPGGAPKNAGLTVYSGNTIHRKAAKIYEVRAGDTIDGIEIMLPLAGLHAIKGVATGKDGVPLSTGSIDLTDATDDAISFHTTIHGGGEFRFAGIPEGTYNLKCTGGRVFDTLPPEEVSTDNTQYLDDTFKPTRAFADTTQSLIVDKTDIEDLVVQLADTTIPAKSQPQPTPSDAAPVDPN